MKVKTETKTKTKTETKTETKMRMEMKLALYGYDTETGKMLLEMLEQHDDVVISELIPLAPLAGACDAVDLRGQRYEAQAVDDFDFARATVALFLCTPDETQRHAARVRESGCVLIDNSRLYSGTHEAAVVLPEVSVQDLERGLKERLLVPPTPSGAQL